MRSRLNVEPYKRAARELVAHVVARRADADAILHRLETGAAKLRIIFEDGTLAVGLKDTDGSATILDAVATEGADAGISVHDLLADELENMPRH